MSPRGTRTPIDLWWVAVIGLTVAGIGFDWSLVTISLVSVAAAVVLGIGHLGVTRRRGGRRRPV